MHPKHWFEVHPEYKMRFIRVAKYLSMAVKRSAGLEEPEEEIPPSLASSIALLERFLEQILQAYDINKIYLPALVKQTMIQLDPSFDENDYGFERFADYFKYVLQLKRIQKSLHRSMSQPKSRESSVSRKPNGAS